MPYITESEYAEKIETIVKLEEENEKLKEQLGTCTRFLSNTEIIGCKQTDCIDYNKETCLPWKCSCAMKNHDDKIRDETKSNIITKIENDLNETDRYWKGMMKSIDIIRKKF